MNIRTQDGDAAQARNRLQSAQAYLQVAEMVAEDDSDDALRGVAAGLAVLAGIAASDAVCCAALGRRSRGDNHKDAVKILGSISEEAKLAATSLRRLIDIKDQAHYGFTTVSAQTRTTSLNAARKVVAFAEQTVA
ncbi:MAG: hypothetical protein H0V81_11875 [Solirubrobacterales bacterium]|nr:hypothetical protein [Solirubrobacterales bacterium]